MSPGIEQAESPAQYNPEFCQLVRASCASVQQEVAKKIDKLDGRMWKLLLLGFGNLATALGGALTFFIVR